MEAPGRPALTVGSRTAAGLPLTALPLHLRPRHHGVAKHFPDNEMMDVDGAFLRRRSRRIGSGDQRGEFVLLWLHHALRVADNPALAAACRAAERLSLPLLVYQGLGGHHRFNADRHHRFILEGARDLHQQLQTIGLGLHFHLPRDPRAPGPLGGLIERAALLISEEYPVPPFTRWYAAHVDGRVNREPGGGTETFLLDCACVVPMQAFEQAPERAYEFRRQARPIWHKAVQWRWQPDQPVCDQFTGDAGFEPFDLDRDQHFADAIAACDIDHSLPAVADSVGGTRAGWQRWRDFSEAGLYRYAARRNDAAADGVSRLSPYLHYGMISPFALAREADQARGKGPDKFLDELFVWRELAHHFCFHHADHLETLEALPDWARQTLMAHADDPRPAIYGWEQTARGATGEALWDLAQTSLLRHGELHNNLRMTWGKALPHWTPDPETALTRLVDLNHRFALDGNDPNSYGGLLWCLGALDRPFSPEKPVLGSVRPRSLAAHARRLDMERYRQQVQPPAGGSLRVAVVGAGISGLTCARALRDQGHEVVVFEKSRGVGGRAATRRRENDQGQDHRFDHGAQYFTARHPLFRQYVNDWLACGVLQVLSPQPVALEPERRALKDQPERYVPTGGMSALGRHLAASLEVKPNSRLTAVEFSADGWRLRTEDGEIDSTFDALVLTPPAPQTAALLGDHPLAEVVQAVEMEPVWSLLLSLSEPLKHLPSFAFVNDSGPLSWICRQADRPGFPDHHDWLLHADHEWSRQHLEVTADAVVEPLLRAFSNLAGERLEIESAQAHRWRYAQAGNPLDGGCLWHAQSRLAVAGDWCAGNRIEGAFLSGNAAAGRILSSAVERTRSL